MHDVIDLPIERVNALSPYKVYINNNGSLGFETQYGSVYEVGFVEDYTFMDENAFQFFILESQGKHSVKDPLVRETIWVILETFFLENNPVIYNPQIQISAESETKRSIFREKDKTKRSKKESAQHSKSRNKSFVMTSVSAL